MTSNKLIMEPFICWEHGENYPFSACMKKLMECLGGDSSSCDSVSLWQISKTRAAMLLVFCLFCM